MFDLVKNIISAPSSYNNIDSYVLYCCIVLILLGTVVTIDLAYKMILRFLPKDSK